MFIYTGKLHWEPYGVNELLVVVLPNGPARAGDTIFTHSQWTVDSRGNRKQNWSQCQTIDKVTRSENGEDTFYFGKGYYSYAVQAQQGYQALSITMSNPGGSKKTMSVDRTYTSSGDVSMDEARIWTGKLSWDNQPKKADNEPFMAIVPDGFGADKPILAFWQWSEADNQSKVNYTYKGSQQTETASGGCVKFSVAGDFTMACTWDEKTKKLAVRLGQGESHVDLGLLDLAISIKLHSHDINPPEIPSGKAELDLYLPQAEPALSRIHSPMPFPRTLVETLTYTASYLDQAGYQAKYAVNQYSALDKSYHAVVQQNNVLKGQISDLGLKLTALEGESENEKKQIDGLQKKLTETLDSAAKTEAELTKTIQELQATLNKEKAHDAEDHKALDEAYEQIRKGQEEKAALVKQVVQLQFALAEGAVRIQQFQNMIKQLTHDVSELRGELMVEKEHNDELQKQVSELKTKVSSLDTDLAATKKTLARTSEDLKQAQADCDEKDNIIEGLETGIVSLKKDRDAKKHAYDELKKTSSARIQELEDEVAKLKSQLAAGTGGGAGNSANNTFPLPNGWPFPGKTGQGGCWPTPGDMILQMQA
ncbi:hypothetical protein MFIFM68171_08219 [Madurella fahalii]|uniref:Uncharacterized protein n=1 Tax=Madurella fahalii TaxID=1157608 RepID=A0ABQ0GJS2_9PEZI